MPNAETILQEAARLTSGERRHDYGAPFQEAERIAEMVRGATGLPIQPEHVHPIMICLKLYREMYHPKRDNRVDLAGYAQVYDTFWEERTEVEAARKAISEST